MNNTLLTYKHNSGGVSEVLLRQCSTYLNIAINISKYIIKGTLFDKGFFSEDMQTLSKLGIKILQGNEVKELGRFV